MSTDAMTPLRFIQITDTHLFDRADGTLRGMNTADTLATVVAQVRAREAHIDGILATGDLSHDGGTPAYRRLIELLAPLNAPVYCLPGNHDALSVFGCVLKGSQVQSGGRLLTVGSLAFPVVLLVFAFLRPIPLALAGAAAAGFASLMTLNLTNSLLQTTTSDELRGRVMSLYTLTLFGLMPVGGLLTGLIAEHFSEPAAVVAGALVTLTCTAALAVLTPRVRRLP